MNQKEEPFNFEADPFFRDAPASIAFPIEALGAIIGPAARAIADIVKAPDALCAQSVLAAAALAVQALRDVNIDGRTYPLSGNFISVAQSGERKTGVDKVALRAHRKWEKGQADMYAADRQKFTTENEIYKRAKSEALKRATKTKLDRKETEEEIKKLGSPPKAPQSKILLVEEPTYEGLVKLLEVNHPTVGLFSDEGGRLLGGYAMNEDNAVKTLAGLSNLWDGSPVNRTRVEDGTTTLYGRRLSLHIMIQPGIATRLLSDEIAADQGFLSRCLIAWPDSTVGTRTYAQVNVQTCPELIVFWERMEEALKRPLPKSAQNQNELNPAPLELDAGTYNDWVLFHDNVESNLGDGRPYDQVRAFASKCGEHVLRIAGILTLTENLDAVLISRDRLADAITIVRFYLQEALRINGTSHVAKELVQAKQLIEWIRGSGLSRVYLSQIYQYGPAFVRTKEKAEKMMFQLVEHGYLLPSGSAEIDGKFRKKVWTTI